MQTQFDYAPNVARKLIDAVTKQDLDVARQLLSSHEIYSNRNYQDASLNDTTALHIACEKRNLKITNLLLDSNCNTDLLTIHNETPLIYACKRGIKGVVPGSKREANREAIVTALIDHGANVNIRSNAGDSALSCAVATGNVKIVTSLLDAGADTSVVDDYGNNLLAIAASNGAHGVLEVLLPILADSVNQVNNNGSTALHNAAFGLSDKKDRAVCIRLLLDSGIDRSIVNQDGATAGDVANKPRLRTIIESYGR